MASAQVEPLSPVITSPAMTARPDRAKRRKDLLLDDEVRPTAAPDVAMIRSPLPSRWLTAAAPPAPVQVLMTSNMEGRKYSACSVYTYWFFCVISCGLVWLGFQWCKKALRRLVSRPAPPEQADFFIIDGVDGTHEICHGASHGPAPPAQQPHPRDHHSAGHSPSLYALVACPAPAVERVAAEPQEMVRARRCCSCTGGPAIPRSDGIPLSQRMVVYRHSRFMWSEAARAYALLVPEDFAPAA